MFPFVELNAPAVLFRASEGTGADTPFIEIYEGSLLGWERWVTQPVVLREMSGGHSSMLQDPNVAAMADRFHECLAEAIGVEAGARWTS